MKSVFILFMLFLLSFFTKAQNNLPFAVEILQNGFDCKFILKQDISTQNIIISIDVKGNIELSVNDQAEIKYYWLETSVGGKVEQIDDIKIEYYFDANNAGKIKKIGNLLFTYYDYQAHESKTGKVKSIGNYTFDYHDFMAEEGKTGKISKIGNILINYYYGFENSGKISRIGNIRINYNTDFDDNINSGKTVSIVGSQEGVIIKTPVFFQKL
jgi:hypothetical protein